MTSKKSSASNSKVSISKKIQNLGNVENDSPNEILLERIHLHECTGKISNLKKISKDSKKLYKNGQFERFSSLCRQTKII